MNIERGLRRLLVLVTLVLVFVVVAWRVLLSQPPVTCMYHLILADGALVKVPAPQGTTGEHLVAAARRLHPETQNPLPLEPRTGNPKKDLVLGPPPDEPAVPESCDATERASARVVRYAWDVTVGIAVALPIAAVLRIAFFALRWVARGFNSAA